MQPIGIGIVGAGVIFEAYVNGLASEREVHLLWVADIDLERAAAKARVFEIPNFGSLAEMLRDPNVQVVINITPPQEHAQVTNACLKSGKNVYVEKPFAASFAEAKLSADLARERGLTVGVAPDTFLGQSGRTALAAIEAGAIGTPIAATSFARSSRVETWHPNAALFYARGAGPALDWGPYHVAALINLLGPVARVTGVSRQSTELRYNKPGSGEATLIPVEIPTHVTGILEFNGGVVATVVYSFDVWETELPHIEIYGTAGTLSLPDPDEYDLPVKLRSRGLDSWVILNPVGHPANERQLEWFRGPGVMDLVHSLSGARHQTSAEFGLNVLAVLEALQDGTTLTL